MLAKEIILTGEHGLKLYLSYEDSVEGKDLLENKFDAEALINQMFHTLMESYPQIDSEVIADEIEQAFRIYAPAQFSCAFELIKHATRILVLVTNKLNLRLRSLAVARQNVAASKFLKENDLEPTYLYPLSLERRQLIENELYVTFNLLRESYILLSYEDIVNVFRAYLKAHSISPETWSRQLSFMLTNLSATLSELDADRAKGA